MLRNVHVHANCGNTEFQEYVMLKTYKTSAFFVLFSEKMGIPCKYQWNLHM